MCSLRGSVTRRSGIEGYSNILCAIRVRPVMGVDRGTFDRSRSWRPGANRVGMETAIPSTRCVKASMGLELWRAQVWDWDVLIQRDVRFGWMEDVGRRILASALTRPHRT